MDRFFYWLYRKNTLYRIKKSRNITPAGFFTLGVIFISFSFGMHTDKSMIYHIASLSFCMFFFGVLVNLVFKPNVDITRIFPENAAVGTPFTYTLIINNRGKKPLRGCLYKEEMSILCPSKEDFINIRPIKHGRGLSPKTWLRLSRWQWHMNRINKVSLNYNILPNIGPGETREVQVSLSPLKRGVVHFSGYRLYKLDPFSLIRKDRFFHDEANLQILPRIYPVPTFRTYGSRKYQPGGYISAVNRGESMEFSSLRDYQNGDPVKWIDWKSTARTTKTIVKEFRDEYFSRFALALDTFSESQDGERFEDAVSVAASFINASHLQSGMVDLLFLGSEAFTASSGKGMDDYRHLLQVLSSVESHSVNDFRLFSSSVFSHIPFVSGLIFVMFDINTEKIQFIESLIETHLPLKVIVISPDPDTCSKKWNLNSLSANISVFREGYIAQHLAMLKEVQ